MTDPGRWGTIVRRLLLAAGLLPLLATAQAQGPTTRYVSHDPTCGGQTPCYTTIQGAITAAQAGDTVVIQAGTYTEQLSISGKNNTPSASEADRIVIEADPAEPAGSVVLVGAVSQCTNGHAVRVQQSKYVTLRGLTITGAGGQAVALLGGSNQNRAIHLEGLRIVGNGSGSCNGGITISQGNPDTLVANSLIYGNGRNGVSFLDATGGPHWLIGNTIHGNAWSGVTVARSHVVHLVNNLITGNGTATGSTGGRFGVTREGSTTPDPAGIRLLNNVLCGNRLGEVDGPALDATDAGNWTPTGAEGPGVTAVPSPPGCALPAVVYASLNGPDGLPNTVDDDFGLAGNSPAVDHGLDPRTLGLPAGLNPILESDYLGPAARPRAGIPGGPAAFDAGAVERLGQDTTAPTVAFTQPDANAFVRQTVTVAAQASDAGWVASLGLSAGLTPLTPTLSPSPPAPTVTATATWSTTGAVDGVYTLTATAADQAGHTTSVTRVVTVDNTPPDTQIQSGPVGTISETTATFTFTGADNLSLLTNLQFAWRLDGGAFSAFGPGTSATVTGLTAGPHTFEVKARDQAGNEDPSPASQSFTVGVGPTITALEPDTGPIGTLVTVRGLNFAATPAGNTVRFAGVAAVVRTASPTAITTTVPPQAPTGPVTVTTAQGLATSPGPFTVTTAQDFGIQVTPGVSRLIQGSSTVYVVELPNSGSQPFTSLASLSVEGLPTGVTATFGPAALAGGQRGTLVLAAAPGVPPGSAMLTVRATASSASGLMTSSATTTLTIEAGGRTALLGRILTVDGSPIVGAQLSLEGLTATTDGAGRYLFVDAPAGEQTLSIDTNIAVAGFPIYAVDVSLADGQTTEAPTFWITPPPPPERFVPIDNATQDQVVTDPRFPGASITLPAGVTITGWDGVPKTRIALQRLSPDRLGVPPPPGPTRSLYQAYFGTPMGGLPSGPLPITVPNDQALEPGDQAEFWYYDAAPFAGIRAGWRLAGLGTVSPDGLTVVSNPGVGITRFCGHCGVWCMIPNQNLQNNRNPGSPDDGEPVNLVLGQQIIEKTDLAIPGRIPLVIGRSFNPIDAFGGIAGVDPGFGLGWAPSWGTVLLTQSPSVRRLILAGNARSQFVQQADGTFINPTDAGWAGAVLTAEGGDAYRLRLKDGTVWRFRDVYLTGLGQLVEQIDRAGNRLEITYGFFGLPSRITESGGRSVTFTIDPGIRRITAIRDPLGRTVQYGYDSTRRLATVTDPAGGVTRYTYHPSGGILTITDPRGITYLTHEYDADGRISRQIQADGGVWTFVYGGPAGRHTNATGTDPRGFVTAYRMDSMGYLVEVTDALGQVTRSEHDALGREIVRTDPLGRVTRGEYDAVGNVTRRVNPAGQEWRFTYEPTFNRMTSARDPLGQTTLYEYDAQGNLTAVVDPTGARSVATYDAVGQLESHQDALGHVTRVEYDPAGNPTAVEDPLGNRTIRAYDAVSRLLSHTDPRGATTAFVYDAMSRLVAVRDAHGQVTGFGYDGNGNLLTVIDSRGGTTVYSYDSMDRVATRRDPVGATESFEYDGRGNLIRRTDRKGQTALLSYDALNRPVLVTRGDGTTTSLTYDAAGRQREVRDSAGGTLLNEFDDLDRLVAQTTELGTVGYQYDALGRRTALAAPGQATVGYGYDAASRLTQLTQGARVVTIEHDAAGRRTRLALPNGVATVSEYDAASRLTALRYSSAGASLGELTYEYDAAGSRIAVGGSLARTLLPDPVATTSYDAANRQLTLGATTLTFDANGNLSTLTDASGVTTLSWDARDRLVGLSGPATTATFRYDAADRRIAMEIRGEATQYQYDGADVLQEVRAGTVVPYLSTLAIDEPLARGDGEFYVADALGSAVALTDAAGALQTEYTYGPFGLAAAAGAPSANPFQYTGRENDGTDLYYYRARYYHPSLHRFVSEDPVPLANGQPNAYAYALNNPIRYTDPLGLCEPIAPDTIVDAGFILYDLYRLIADGRKGLEENLTALGADVAGACIPFVTGLGFAARIGKAGKRFNEQQRALIELAKEAKRTGVTKEEGKILFDWAKEYGLGPQSHGPAAHPTRAGPGGTPHVNIGPVKHIFIK